jgi:hypothetical protein
MLLPVASTFTWWLVNGPNREIIRGEVSIFRGGAGGLSYFSSGSFRSTFVGASWPEAMETKNSESRQVKTLAFNILEGIIIRNFLAERCGLMPRERIGNKQCNKQTDFQGSVWLRILPQN